MEALGIFFRIVSVLAVFGLAFWGVKEWNTHSYLEGFEKARQDFFSKGYEEGKSDGYNGGYKEGYEQGYDVGGELGTATGKNSILKEMPEYGEERYDEGFYAGRTIGQNTGYNSGGRVAYDNALDCLETARYPTAPKSADYHKTLNCINELKLAVPTN